MKTAATPRRAVLVGVVAAFASPALATIAPDPIFAAIERHKLTYRRASECGAVAGSTADWGPEFNPVEHKRVHDAEDAADEADAAAAMALTTIPPTTTAGLVALLSYVESFNSGAYVVADWGASSPIMWPAVEFDEDESIDGFSYLILANVRAALEAMAVQS